MRRAILNAWLMPLLLMILAPVTRAQVVLGPAPIIGGIPMQCFGVTTVVAPINDVAIVLPGQIVLSPTFAALTWEQQRFVYAHECGHHLNGPDENAADCWAARVGRQQGWFTARGLFEVLETIYRSPGDWTHAPGPIRQQNIMACYQSSAYELQRERLR